MGTTGVADVAGSHWEREVTAQQKSFLVVEWKESDKFSFINRPDNLPILTGYNLLAAVSLHHDQRVIHGVFMLISQTVKHIDLIAGARANFTKIAPIIDALNAAETRGSSLRFRLIHTGQHYDRAMSGSFFEELAIPDPDVNLQVDSGTQAERTAVIMVNYEQVLLKQESDRCMVVEEVT